MSIRKSSQDRASERPDLRAERETFVRNFLHKGVELTEDLIRENRGLEHQVLKLQEENALLREQLASNDAIRDLLTTIESLQHERKALLNRGAELEKQKEQHEERHSAVEQELNDLASLYVASFQLSATLSVRRVVRHICELLEQLVGAQSFVVYVVSPDGKRVSPIGSRGYGKDEHPPVLSAEEGPIGDVCLTGVARMFAPDDPREPGDPIALLPLSFDGEVIGIIAVDSLLPHKRSWARVDEELFKLLSVHGATALIAANLYEEQSSARASLSDVAEHIREQSVENAKDSVKRASSLNAKAGG
ncbi:MAG TPA: GAF domain-containing protein [Polyangiaceae bacterium]|nr:GAF domain-containing protein [Polyangiaceae bacterium]